MDNFVAIDVETANYQPTSIFSIGAVKVKGGVIVDSFYTLVQPEPNYYIRRFTQEIHGISREMTDDAPAFGSIWGDLERFIEGLPLVAHNKSFDEKCIKATCSIYQIDYPEYPFLCTLQASRKQIPKYECGSHSLPVICRFFGIPFNNHHNALADAEACAKIAMTLL